MRKFAKVILFSVIPLFFTFNSYGQSIINESVSSNHVSTESSGVRVSTALGEVSFEGGTNSDGNVVEGSIQPHLSFYVTLEEIKDQVEIKVFPNPTSDKLFITTTHENDFQGVLYNLEGKELQRFELKNSMELSFREYSTGLYTIMLVDKITKQKNTYKIVNK